MDKVFLIDKEDGITSHDVVYRLRRKLNIKKIGHTGTLDPFATGLLIVCVGEATKIARFIEAQKKTYVAQLRLGIKTNTGDLSGEIVKELDIPNIDIQTIEEVFASFIGEISQVPPMYSAIKINGQKLYNLARKGEIVDRPQRKVTIHALKILKFENNILTFEVECSKGTYVRTLGEDIAEKLGTCGNLISLRRTKIGDNLVENAYKIDEIDEEKGFLIKQTLDLPKIVVDNAIKEDIKNGKLVKMEYKGEYVLFLDENDIELAIYSYEDDGYHCERGFNIC